MVEASFLAQCIFPCNDIFCVPFRNNYPHLSHRKRKDAKMILSPTISYKYDSGWLCWNQSNLFPALQGVRLFLDLLWLQNRLQKLFHGIFASVEFRSWCFTIAPHLVRISTCNVAACFFCVAHLFVFSEHCIFPQNHLLLAFLFSLACCQCLCKPLHAFPKFRQS